MGSVKGETKSANFWLTIPIVISDLSLQPIRTGYSDILYVFFEVLILIFVNPIIIPGKSLYPVTL